MNKKQQLLAKIIKESENAKEIYDEIKKNQKVFGLQTGDKLISVYKGEIFYFQHFLIASNCVMIKDTSDKLIMMDKDDFMTAFYGTYEANQKNIDEKKLIAKTIENVLFNFYDEKQPKNN